MDMEQPKTTIKDVVSDWHGQLMTLSTTLEMLSNAETHTNEGSQMGSVIHLVHGHLRNVLDEMDRASLTMPEVESAVQSLPTVSDINSFDVERATNGSILRLESIFDLAVDVIDAGDDTDRCATDASAIKDMCAMAVAQLTDFRNKATGYDAPMEHPGWAEWLKKMV